MNYSVRWVYGEGFPSNVFSLNKELVNENPTLETIEKFLEALKVFPVNFMFVTINGDIGYHMTGLFPKRKYNVA